MAFNLYQNILHKLSLLPPSHLEKVDAYLSQLQRTQLNKEANRQAILALAGGWSDLSEEDFQEVRRAGRDSVDELFGRNVEW